MIRRLRGHGVFSHHSPAALATVKPFGKQWIKINYPSFSIPTELPPRSGVIVAARGCNDIDQSANASYKQVNNYWPSTPGGTAPTRGF